MNYVVRVLAPSYPVPQAILASEQESLLLVYCINSIYVNTLGQVMQVLQLGLI